MGAVTPDRDEHAAEHLGLLAYDLGAAPDPAPDAEMASYLDSPLVRALGEAWSRGWTRAALAAARDLARAVSLSGINAVDAEAIAGRNHAARPAAVITAAGLASARQGLAARTRDETAGLSLLADGADPRSAQLVRDGLIAAAARLNETRRRASCDVPAFAALAATAPLPEVVRMTNRLRVTLAIENRLPGPPAARVPSGELGEVWDAPVRSWTWHGVTRHTVAVAVTGGLYLQTNQGGTYESPQDWFGLQVIARADTPGEPPVFAVFWRCHAYSPYAAPNGWRQATEEMSAAGIAAWNGRPTGRFNTPARDLTAWLDQVVAAGCDG